MNMNKLTDEEKRFAERALEWRLLRRVWKAIAPDRRTRFKEILGTLVSIDKELRTITPFVTVSEIPTGDPHDDLHERGEAFAPDKTLPWDFCRASMLSVSPGEYLAAIACWEAGHDYVRPA